MMWSKNAEN